MYNIYIDIYYIYMYCIYYIFRIRNMFLAVSFP